MDDPEISYEEKFKSDWKKTPKISEVPIVNWVEKVLLGFFEEK